MGGIWESGRVLVLFAAVGLLCGCQIYTSDSVPVSHIEANVPDAATFQQLLSRALKSYLSDRAGRNLDVEYVLLRQGPTQTGVSYPKYYLWVKATDGKQVVLEGAARVAAIERLRFEVTNFLSRDEIRASPDEVEKIFPAALKAMILKKATTN